MGLLSGKIIPNATAPAQAIDMVVRSSAQFQLPFPEYRDAKDTVVSDLDCFEAMWGSRLSFCCRILFCDVAMVVLGLFGAVLPGKFKWG